MREKCYHRGKRSRKAELSDTQTQPMGGVRVSRIKRSRKEQSMDLNKKNVKKIMGIITFTVILFVLLMNFSAVLKWLRFIWGVCFPFVLGGAIAFCLNIPMSFFERKLTRLPRTPGKLQRALARPVSFILTLFCIILILAVVVIVLVPELTKTFESIGTAMTDFLPKAQAWLEDVFSGKGAIAEFISSMELDWTKWLNSIKDFALNGAGNVLSVTMNATVAVVDSVTTFFIAFIFAIYVLMQKENLSRQLTKLIKAIWNEKTVEKICQVCSLSYYTFSRFITGQCIEALILGTMFFVVMSLFRFPYALLVGVVIAMTALIPIVGAFVGCIVGAFLILMVNPMQALAFVILFLVLQQIEGNLIYPHVVGNSVGLPSMWVLFAVTVGGSLMGVAGMLIFIPIMSVLYSLLRDWVNGQLKERKTLQKP